MSDTLLAILSLTATIGFYYLTRFAYQRRRAAWRAPILAAPLAVLILVLSLGIPLDDYFYYTRFLVMMLGPATIAFAVPIYQQRATIRRYPLTLSAGVIAGLLFGILSSWLLLQVFPLPAEMAGSMLVRSVSTPFAMEAALFFGGVPDITALLVLMTGVIGMVVCEPVFRIARIRTSLARGAALGASAHGAGTAKAQELGSEEGMIASLTMIFAGIAMVICAPFFAQILG